MAGLADVLYPAAETAQIPEAAFWKAWHPDVPYTGSIQQQREIVRLRDMQDQNMASTPVGTPETSQGAVANQNAQVMQQPIEGGVMAPLQAVGIPQPTVIVPDAPTSLQPVKPAQSAVQPMSPSEPPQFSAPPVGSGGAPAGEGFAGLLQPAQPSAQPAPPPASAPQAAPQAAPASPQHALLSPETPPQSKWKIMLEQMQKPEVMGPLQTFFTALAAPLAPWETMGSRLGRASMLMNMHKGMLAQNVADVPRQEQMKDLAIRGKTAEVSTAESKADVADALKDTVIAKAMQDLENARLDGDSKAESIAGDKLKNRLVKIYGDEKAAAEIFSTLSDVKYKQRMATVYEKNADTTARTAATKPADISSLPLGEMEAQVRGLAEAFHGSGASTSPDVLGDMPNFIAWVSENYGKEAARDLNSAMAKLKMSGVKLQYNSLSKPAQSQPTASFTLGADGVLKANK